MRVSVIADVAEDSVRATPAALSLFLHLHLAKQTPFWGDRLPRCVLVSFQPPATFMSVSNHASVVTPECGASWAHLTKVLWRAGEPGLVAEHETYDVLEEKFPEDKGAPVPHASELLCGGAVCYPEDETLQNTCSPIDRQGTLPRRWEYKHTRMVLEHVGKPLSDFKQVSEFLVAIMHAVEGHKHALNRGVLHRDISSGSILIRRDAEVGSFGALIDWDVCYPTSHTHSNESWWTTGIWQFMSIDLLSRREGHMHSVKDDLEAVFWLLFYNLARYTNLWEGSNTSLEQYMRRIFEEANGAPLVQQRADRPKAKVGGQAKRQVLEEMTIPLWPNSFRILPTDVEPALRQLLYALAKSRHFELLYRNTIEAVKRLQTNPPKEDDPIYDDYEEALEDIARMDKRKGKISPFDHDLFARAFTQAVDAFKALESRQAPYLNRNKQTRRENIPEVALPEELRRPGVLVVPDRLEDI